ncbi:hypothetical protein ACHHYP_15676 [Achlya hypogyna]|uniref:F-box domain-containing protein n=1 Tax=Achlya hypogyna TaxID=1202772 RepID=A0A1V9YAD5_ACHHY|nr:hypothetical protein ACHHYP_15676 [Achlya hypogyna]
MADTQDKGDQWIVLNPQYQLVVHPRVRRLIPEGILGGISEESIANILAFLDGKSLTAMGHVCRQLRDASNNDAFWLANCRFEWGIEPSQLSQRVPITGKELYRVAHQSLTRLTKAMMEEQCMMAMQRAWCLSAHTIASIAQSRSMFQYSSLLCTIPKPV